MAFYVPPDAEIRLLGDVPIDAGSEHTLWFANIQLQTEYFLSKTAFTFTAQSYTRQGRGMIKLEISHRDAVKCNYIMYRNTAFSTKWFYGSITSCEYVNNVTTRLTFKIDQLQTWMFDMILGECFVERQHSETDEIGDNLVPENLEVGEYEYDFPSQPTLGDLQIVIAATVEWDDDIQDFVDAVGGVYGGQYSGLHYTVFPFTTQGIADCNQWLYEVTRKGKSDSVVSMFMIPSKFLVNGTGVNTEVYTYTDRTNPYYQYSPKNNKLFTAPYMSLICKTPTNAAEYGFEYFSYPPRPEFRLTYVTTTSPSILLEPINYKTRASGTAGSVGDNYIEGMSLTGWPQCAFNIDAYKAWLAQNGATLAVNGALAVAGLGMTIASGIATTGISAGSLAYPGLGIVGSANDLISANEYIAAGPPQYMGTQPHTTFSPNATGMIGSLGAIGNILAQMYQHSILPPHARGTADATAEFARGRFNFKFCIKHIRNDYARIIDDYFTKFGYAIHRLKTPNMHARESFTYVKTIDCIVHGYVPAEAVTEIQGLFNRGITFWANPNVVGNYGVTNSVLS